MTTVKQTGVTVETAIEKALQQLNVSQEEVEIEILDEGRKGFLGIGARDAVVQVTVKPKVEPTPVVEEVNAVTEVVTEEVSSEVVEEIAEEEAELEEESESTREKRQQGEKDPIEAATDYLKNVAKEMNIHDLEVTTESDGKYIYFQLESKKAALLIGKRGQTLHALQLLCQLVANQYSESFKVIRLNVGDYRERREEALELLANRMADKAVSTNRKVQLEPMLAYERKVIHNALSNRLDIETYSEGTEPHRYLVIEPIR